MALQTFTAGQVLTAAQMTSLQANDYNQTVSTKTASYTLVAADKGTRVVMNSASATTITVNTSLFSAGDTLILQNIGAGVCTVTAGTATVSSAGSLAISQNGSGTLYFTSAGVSIYYPSAVTSASGLAFITGTSFTTATTVSLPASTFTSTYRNYRISFSLTALTADADITLRMRASGTDNTTSNYFTMFTGINSAGTIVSNTNQLASSFTFAESDSTFAGLYKFSFDVLQPQVTQATVLQGNLSYYTKTTTQAVAVNGSNWFNDTTQFDSLTVISSVASSMTGVYRVYGYSES